MGNFSQSFLEKTKKVWEPDYGRTLTLEEARVIAENVIGFFELLIKWRKEREKYENE